MYKLLINVLNSSVKTIEEALQVSKKINRPSDIYYHNCTEKSYSKLVKEFVINGFYVKLQLLPVTHEDFG